MHHQTADKKAIKNVCASCPMGYSYHSKSAIMAPPLLLLICCSYAIQQTNSPNCGEIVVFQDTTQSQSIRQGSSV